MRGRLISLGLPRFSMSARPISLGLPRFWMRSRPISKIRPRIEIALAPAPVTTRAVGWLQFSRPGLRDVPMADGTEVATGRSLIAVFAWICLRRSQNVTSLARC
jgi:hypothetical protein